MEDVDEGREDFMEKVKQNAVTSTMLKEPNIGLEDQYGHVAIGKFIWVRTQEGQVCKRLM